MEEKFRIFQANFQTNAPQTNAPKSKGKGRGKKSSQKDTQFSEEVAREAQRRLRSFLQSSEPSSSVSNTEFEPSAPPLEAGYWTEDNSSIAGSQASASIKSMPKLVGATDKVYITNIEVTLNGTPLDQVMDQQNEEECMQAYWRLFTFNGQMNSLFTNGIRNDIMIFK